MEAEVKPKRKYTRRAKVPEVKVASRVWEGKDLVLKISAFIPGQEPQEISITVQNFAGNTFGRQKTAAGIRENLVNALKAIYGGFVK